MAEIKFHWLKLKDDFFDEKYVKALRRLPQGDSLVVVYLKMQLVSLKTEGLIKYEGIMPDCISELSMILDEDENVIKLAVEALIRFGVIERWENDTLYMKALQQLIGAEHSSTERVRRHRENQKKISCDIQNCQQKMLIESNETDCNANETLHETQCNVTEMLHVTKSNSHETLHETDETNCNAILDKEIDKDIRDRLVIDHSESKRSARVREGEGTHTEFRKSTLTAEAKFIIPSLDEVKAYCAEINCSVDAERFIDYHAACGWRLNATPIRDWRAVLRCWSKNGNDALHTARANKGGKTVAQAHFAQEREYSKEELAAILSRDISEFV